jgi:hypothetical protein
MPRPCQGGACGEQAMGLALPGGPLVPLPAARIIRVVLSER